MGSGESWAKSEDACLCRKNEGGGVGPEVGEEEGEPIQHQHQHRRVVQPRVADTHHGKEDCHEEESLTHHTSPDAKGEVVCADVVCGCGVVWFGGGRCDGVSRDLRHALHIPEKPSFPHLASQSWCNG